MQNGQFGSKIKNTRRARKTIVKPHWSCCVQKNRLKKDLILEKREPFENGQNWPKGWVIAHAKWSLWVKI